MTFSLLTEPWIPVADLSGRTLDISLQDALLRPEQWRGISTVHPIECIALHRLLLAICHRAIGPGDLSHRADLIDTWPITAIETYLNQWAERFDLFHPDRPFSQHPGIAAAGAEPKPITRIIAERSSGDNRVMWDRSTDDNPLPLTPATAARSLIAHHQFVLGGAIRCLQHSGQRGPGAELLLTIPTGDTLQSTLAMALVPQTLTRYQLDIPSWEAPLPTIEALSDPVEPVVPMGPAQRYSWQSRTLLLQPDADGTTAYVLYGGGMRMPPELPEPDPMAACCPRSRGDVPGPPSPALFLRLRADRGMWRDLAALTVADGTNPPATICNAAAIQMLRGSFDPIGLVCGGLASGSNPAKIGNWRLEIRTVCPALLATPDGVAQLTALLELITSTGTLLSKALTALGKAWGDLPAGWAGDALAVFWGSMEAPVWAAAAAIPSGAASDGPPAFIAAGVRTAWTYACNQLGRDGRALAAAARADRALGRVLASLR